MSREWIELVDPKSAKPFYANVKTGNCTWDKPKGASFDGKGSSDYKVEWWELYDKKHEMPYYYNTKTKYTDWIRPEGVEIISLIKLQQTTILKNVSRNSIIKYEVKNEDFYDQDEFNNSKLKISDNTETHKLSVIIDNSVLNSSDVSQVNYSGTPGGHSQILPVSMKFEHYKRLSSEIFNHIKNYGIDEYAKKNFMEHRRGLFRKKIPVESLICWSKQSLRKPLLKSSRNYYKDALHSFSLIQSIIGDKNSSGNFIEVQKLLEIGLSNSAIRDEIYCQVCKQLNKNPNFGHIVLGWKLMSVLVVTFPPSREFEDYLKCFIEKYTHSSWSRNLIKETLGNQHIKNNNNDGEIKNSNNSDNNSYNSNNSNKSNKSNKSVKSDKSNNSSKSNKSNNSDKSNKSNNSNNNNDVNFNIINNRKRSYKRVNSIRKVGGMVINAANSISSISSKKSIRKGSFMSKNNKSVESLNHHPLMDSNNSNNSSYNHFHFNSSNNSNESLNDKENKNDIDSIDENDERVQTIQILSKHCYKKLARTCIVGPRGKPLSLKEIEQKMNAAFNFSYFGETLEDIMEEQKKERNVDLDIPDIMIFLTNAILKLNGCQTEGIFRVPGDADSITELRYQVEKKNFDLKNCSDPHVPASLLKLWLRELAEPLISTDAYEKCISIGKRECEENIGIEAWELMNSLPEINRLVINYMIDFLKIIARPENQKLTKMTLANLAMVFAPNFLRCPSDNPQIIFENTKYEQAFLRILIAY